MISEIYQFHYTISEIKDDLKNTVLLKGAQWPNNKGTLGVYKNVNTINQLECLDYIIKINLGIIFLFKNLLG